MDSCEATVLVAARTSNGGLVMENRINTLGTNGTAAERKPRKSKGRIQERKQRTPARKHWGQRKVSAMILGAIGVALLALSLSHCTEAIALLTGSGRLLSLLLALGIDAGMVAAEWALLTGAGDKEVGRWSNAYIIATVALSVLLNCYAFGLHSADGMRWAAWALGAFVPAAVYTLGRVAGKQYLAE